MPQNLKRKAMESPFDVTENPLHFKLQWFNLLQLTYAKFIDSHGDPWPRRNSGEPNYCKIAMLRMTIIRYNESPSTSDAWETGGASEVGNTTYSASLFAEQPAGQRPQEDPGCRPSSSDFYEILDNIEDLLMNPGKAPEQCLEEVASPVADDGLSASSAEDLIPTFQMETRVCECFSPEEPLNNPSPGILEALVATYLGDLSVEGYFEEIDISEFV